jgi:hypothetical protein
LNELCVAPDVGGDLLYLQFEITLLGVPDSEQPDAYQGCAIDRQQGLLEFARR